MSRLISTSPKIANPKLTNPKVVSEMLDDAGITLSHGLGQNFLVNQSIIDKILKLAEANSSDTILEVGPGIGALTVPLLETGAKVIAIEKDSRLKDLLLENTSFAGENFSLIEGDALLLTNFVKKRKNVPDLDLQRALHPPLNPADAGKFVANLPYNVAATLVLDYFQNFDNIKSATVMVQKEVAARMMAQSNSKTYGAYTVKLSLYASVAGYFSVGRNNFMPAPHVDSTVIRLNRNANDDKLKRTACMMADAAFFNRRKTILNSMSAYFSSRNDVDKDAIRATLADSKIDEKTRGETLSKNDFITLAKSFDNLRK